MADLNALNLVDDPIEIADELPEQRGARVPMLQPGAGIIFQLPETFDFEPIPTDQGQRLMVKFRDATVAKTFPGGQAIRTTVSNMEQNRKGKDGTSVKVNPWAYLLRALGYTGPLKTNRDYATAMAQYPGHYFQADWEWSANCSAKRDIYREGGVVKGRSGCGQRYGMRSRTYKDRNGAQKTVLAIPREADGSFVESFRCLGKRADGSQCDAQLFTNGEWVNFQTAPTEESK